MKHGTRYPYSFSICDTPRCNNNNYYCSCNSNNYNNNNYDNDDEIVMMQHLDVIVMVSHRMTMRQ